MLVDVVELRREGRRLQPHQLSTRPKRGLLRLDELDPMWHNDRLKSPLRAMLLDAGGKPEKVLEPLDYVRVVKINGRGMLLIGTQHARTRGRRYEPNRQAWWVRAVGQPEPVATGGVAEP